MATFNGAISAASPTVLAVMTPSTSPMSMLMERPSLVPQVLNFTGGITVGSSGISFWGGAGDDTFNFTGGISNASGTAYFWNADTGKDSINLTALTTSRLVSALVLLKAGLLINYGTVSDAFGTAATTSNIFTIAGSAVKPGNHQLLRNYSCLPLLHGWCNYQFLWCCRYCHEVSTTFGDKEGTIAFGYAASYNLQLITLLESIS